MKNVVITLGISVILVIAMSFSFSYLSKVSQNLSSFNDDIEKFITDGDWDEAYKASIKLSEKWKEYSKKIKLFINHQEIDNIEMELWKLPQYIKEKNKGEALASVHVLKFLVEHITEKEEIKLQNIF